MAGKNYIDEWIESLSALNAGDVGSSDNLLIIQNSESKRVTKSELAQSIAADPALSSTFAPLVSPTFTGNVVVPDADAATEALNRQTADARFGTEIWIPAWQFAPASGTPNPALTRGFASRWQTLTFPDGSTQTAQVAVPIPDHWSTFDISLYWSCATTDTGNVRWLVVRDRAGVGENLNASGSNTGATAATPGQFLLGVTVCGAGITADPSKLCNLRVQRIGNDGADTLATGADLLGVMLSRAS